MVRNGMELNSQLGSLLSLHLSRAGGDQREDENLGDLYKHISSEDCMEETFH